MPEVHRFIVDRHEADLTVVEVDGGGFVDLPRWLLPDGARGDDVLGVTVERSAERALVTITRDAAATERAKHAARDAVGRLRRKDPGGDLTL